MLPLKPPAPSSTSPSSPLGFNKITNVVHLSYAPSLFSPRRPGLWGQRRSKLHPRHELRETSLPQLLRLLQNSGWFCVSWICSNTRCNSNSLAGAAKLLDWHFSGIVVDCFRRPKLRAKRAQWTNRKRPLLQKDCFKRCCGLALDLPNKASVAALVHLLQELRKDISL